jgi:hypothetical protein
VHSIYFIRAGQDEKLCKNYVKIDVQIDVKIVKNSEIWKLQNGNNCTSVGCKK